MFTMPFFMANAAGAPVNWPELTDENATFLQEDFNSYTGTTEVGADPTIVSGEVFLDGGTAKQRFYHDFSSAFSATSGDKILYYKMRMETGASKYTGMYIDNGASTTVINIIFGYNWSTTSVSQGTISYSYNGGASTGVIASNYPYEDGVEIAVHFDYTHDFISIYFKEGGAWELKTSIASTSAVVNAGSQIHFEQGSAGLADTYIDYAYVCEPNIMSIGDSITAGHNFYDPDPAFYGGVDNFRNAYQQMASLAWPNVKNNFVVSKGVGGNTSTQMAARTTDITNSNPAICFCQSSDNDYGGGVTLAQKTTNQQSIITDMNTAGVIPIQTNGIYPNSGHVNFPLNSNYMKDWWTDNGGSYRGGLTGVNYFIDMMAPLIENDLFVSPNYCESDGIHPNEEGYQVIGKYYAYKAGQIPYAQVHRKSNYFLGDKYEFTCGAGDRQKGTLSVWIRPELSWSVGGRIIDWFTDANNYTSVYLGSTGQLYVFSRTGGVTDVQKITTATDFLDNEWHHLVVQFDTTDVTAEDRVKVYYDGVRITSWATNTNPTLNLNLHCNNSNTTRVGSYTAGNEFIGEMYDFHWLDGVVEPTTSFAGTVNGRYLPIEVDYNTITYGAEGFHWRMNGSDQNDVTANVNDGTLTGTVPSYNDNPFDSFAGLDESGSDYTSVVSGFRARDPISSGTSNHERINFPMTSGKWYCEIRPTAGTSIQVGLMTGTGANGFLGSTVNSWGYNQSSGNKFNNGTGSSYGAAFANGDVISVLFDADTGSLSFWKNGVDQGVAFTGLTSGPYYFAVGNGTPGGSTVDQDINTGQDATFFGAESGGGFYRDDNGVGEFNYKPPAGYLACSQRNV